MSIQPASKNRRSTTIHDHWKLISSLRQQRHKNSTHNRIMHYSCKNSTIKTLKVFQNPFWVRLHYTQNTRDYSNHASSDKHGYQSRQAGMYTLLSCNGQVPCQEQSNNVYMAKWCRHEHKRQSAYTLITYQIKIDVSKPFVPFQLTQFYILILWNKKL